MKHFADQGMFGNIYNFTEADLNSNQRGFITIGQRTWLQSIAKGNLRLSKRSLPIGLAFALLGMCMITAMFMQNEETRAVFFSNPLILVALAVSLLFVVAMGALAVFLAKRTGGQLENAKLQSAQGTVFIKQDYSGKSGLVSYHLHIGDQKITFGDDPHLLFKPGGMYRLYYCRAGVYEMILSFEALNG